MYSTCKLNKQGDNIESWRTPFPIWNQFPKLPTSVGTQKKQESSGKTSTIDYAKAFDNVDHNKLENSSRDGNTRPPYLTPEKSVCRSRSNIVHRSIHMHMYIHICICVYTMHIHMCMHLCMYLYTCVNTCTHMYIERGMFSAERIQSMVCRCVCVYVYVCETTNTMKRRSIL